MQSRIVTQEDEKDPVVLTRTKEYRGLPLKLLQLFVLFVAMCVAFSAFSIHTIRYFGARSAKATMKSSFQPCYEELTVSDKWLKPPSNLMHSMTDQELFWRASFMPRRKEYPFPRVRKMAFMFLTKGPIPLAPLWERFLKGHERLYSIYIHSLPSYQPDYPSSSPFYRRQIPSQVRWFPCVTESLPVVQRRFATSVGCGARSAKMTLGSDRLFLPFDLSAFRISEWGKMSMCDAERRLVANALLDISNEWFVLLSESCIPLYNFNLIYHYTMGSKYSFMGSFDEPGPDGRGRYNEKMAPIVNVSQWRKGSQWFEVNRELAFSIIEDTVYHPIFKEYCQPACYVDEHYFPTMLTIQSAHLLANRTLTWTDWSRGGPHPATFGGSDITEEFLRRIRGGHECSFNHRKSTLCYLFARKFAPNALKPLLDLATDLMAF